MPKTSIRNQKTFAFIVNDDKYFLSHRLPIGLELLKRGFNVHVIVGACSNKDKLIKLGFKPHLIQTSRKGKNPFKELAVLFQMTRILREIKPITVHLVNIKPYLYGGVAARLTGVPNVVSAVAGLGGLFIPKNKRAKALQILLKPLYKFAFNHPNQKVIFQNTYDRELLQTWIGLESSKSTLIKGSGADLNQYPFEPEPNNTPPVISLASRLLRDKGVIELVEAAKILKRDNIEVNIQIIGEPDPENSNTLTKEELKAWHDAGLINYLGYRTDIANLFSLSNIIALPSYYGEGLPKVLIEAAACGRAVITTDHPGCRDAIIKDKTGLLVPIKNSQALAKAIKELIQQPQRRSEMGKAGRELAEDQFAIEKIVKQHFSIYEELGASLASDSCYS